MAGLLSDRRRARRASLGAGLATLALAGCATHAQAPVATGSADDYCSDDVRTVRDVIRVDETWSGEVVLAADLMVAEGATLTIEPGTTVTVLEAENTKILPHFLSPQTELLVRGGLRALGTAEEPIRFVPAARGDEGGAIRWQGIEIDGGGESRLDHVSIDGAETGVHVLGGRVRIEALTARDFTYAVIAQGGARVEVIGADLARGDTAYGCWWGGSLLESGTTSSDVRRARLEGPAEHAAAPEAPPLDRSVAERAARSVARTVLTGTVDLDRDTRWAGYVEIDGEVRVNPGVTLTLAPGTVVAFHRLDTDADGFGEQELDVVGTLRALGTAEQPVLFTSAERAPARGDWGAINFQASDAPGNLLRHVVVEHAYRAVHLHFSALEIEDSVFRGNARALEFQESEVSVRRSWLVDNYFGAKLRDATARFEEDVVAGNLAGIEAFRVDLTLAGNRVVANRLHGVRLREGRVRAEGNELSANRRGLLLHESDPLLSGNEISGNAESGIYAKASNARLEGNRIERNGASGVTLSGGAMEIARNEIRANGVNGVSVAAGAPRVHDNAIAGNGEYDLGIDGPGDVDAGGNWWGTNDAAEIRARVWDGEDEAGLGHVRVDPWLESWRS